MKQQELVHFSKGKYMPYIFVSYSHADKDVVNRLVARLEEQGLCVWVDANNLRGQHFADEIRDGIRECSIFLECLSESYVKKAYCEKEFLYADELNKNVLAVCLDQISKEEYPNRFPLGGNAIAFGKGLESDFERYLGEILKQTIMVQLKKFMETGSQEIAMKYVFIDDKLITCLMEHCQKAYKNSGTYCLDQIHKELFPGLADHSKDRVFKPENEAVTSLYEYLLADEKNSEPLLLKGNGGMGKTISMLQTCEHLLGNGILAIYVPLNKIRFTKGDSIPKYIEREVCANDSALWNNLKSCAQAKTKNKDKIYLFLDGLNELPMRESAELMKEAIGEDLILSAAWRGTRFIMSSRYALPQSEEAFDNVKVLEMLPLEEEQIMEFLAKHETAMPENIKVKSLLTNPLMLSLYANAEFYRARYEKRGREYGIQLEKEPDTAGKIIRNFLQTQLLQMTLIEQKDFIVYYVLLEYALPYLAFEMVKREGLITLKEVREILREACDDRLSIRFSWLMQDVLEDLIWEHESASDFTKSDIKNLYTYAVNKYRFLYEGEHHQDTEESYVEFLHQDFRDYFAAYHVANEIKSIRKVPKRIDEEQMALSAAKFPEELVEFCVDILDEEKACPCEVAEGWHFPGKKGIGASKYSITEQSLELFRGKVGAAAQVSIFNLLEIMRKGRRNCLAYCDFSNLDLRACQMNGCHFSEFYRDSIWMSKFDGAFMDKSFLLGEGHSKALTVVCPGEEENIFSADRGGTIKVWNYRTGEVRTLFTNLDHIVNLEFDSEIESLAIVCDDQLMIYDVKHNLVTDKKINRTGSQCYRYVRFNEQHELEYAYDLYPYRWYHWSGEECEDNVDFDVISGCAKRWTNACGTQLVYSEMYQQVHVVDWTDGRRRSIDLKREVDAKTRVEAISYSANGERFLVAIKNYVLEYDAKSLMLIRKKQFHENVFDVRYYGEGIVAAVGKEVCVLGKNWFIHEILKQEKVEYVCMYEEYGDCYYIVSADQTVKELDSELCVLRIRNCPAKGKFTWVRDRKANERQMLFLKEDEIQAGERFNFETGRSMIAGWCFEMLEEIPNMNRKHYILDENQVLSLDVTDASKQYVYQNHGGIWIYGCSFHGIKGTMADEENLLLLKKNGGDIHGK